MGRSPSTQQGARPAFVFCATDPALAFLVTLQCLPPKQRAVLILRDVLDWSAEEVASLLDSSVASVNAARQRARSVLRRRQPRRDEAVPPSEISDAEMLLVRQYVDATERFDTEALTRLLRDDARFSMPPPPFVSVGNSATVQASVEGGFARPPYDDFKLVVTSANRMPAIANYLRKPGDAYYRPSMVDVLRIESGNRRSNNVRAATVSRRLQPARNDGLRTICSDAISSRLPQRPQC
jgi:RNA polymerase sigma-70 factor (ECF subfamily)